MARLNDDGQKNPAGRTHDPATVNISARSQVASGEGGKSCAACGRPWKPRSPRAKYCDDAECRRARDRRRKQDERGADQKGREIVLPETPIPDAAPGELEETIRTELHSRGLDETVNGHVALALARRVDRSFFDTGSSYASLVRELRLALDALSGASSPVSPVDELRRKREERMRAAGE